MFYKIVESCRPSTLDKKNRSKEPLNKAQVNDDTICPICEKSFDNVGQHQEEVGHMFRCPDCEEKFYTLRGVNTHARVHKVNEDEIETDVEMVVPSTREKENKEKKENRKQSVDKANVNDDKNIVDGYDGVEKVNRLGSDKSEDEIETDAEMVYPSDDERVTESTVFGDKRIGSDIAEVHIDNRIVAAEEYVFSSKEGSNTIH